MGTESPPEVWILLGEPVLACQVGDAAVMRKQIEHLAEMAAGPQVTIQVVAAGAGAYGGLSGAFAIGTDSTSGTVIYLETGVQDMAVRDTSSHSGSNGGGGIEAAGHGSKILVRDTQDQTGPVLHFTPAAWRRFTTRVKHTRA